MPVTQYKKVEKEFADRIGSWLRRIWISVLGFFKYVMVKGKQRFTVMLIPHSEKKIFNFQISFFTLIFVTATLSVVLVGFFYLITSFSYTNEALMKVSRESEANAATLQSLKDEIAGLRQAGKGVQNWINDILKTINSQEGYPVAGSSGVSPVGAFAAIEETESGTLKELSDLKTIASMLKNSLEPLSEIDKALSTTKEFLVNIPTLWPLKGVRGDITTRFGWTVNPFTKLGYMHNGLDIAWASGTPVVATADGTVVQVDRSEELGNYVTIQHKYGFSTKYAHLIQSAVKKGAVVNRGKIIGYVGSTGRSTGSHLHYEVHLGAGYTDPMTFLSIKSYLAAQDLAPVRAIGGNGQ